MKTMTMTMTTVQKIPPGELAVTIPDEMPREQALANLQADKDEVFDHDQLSRSAPVFTKWSCPKFHAEWAVVNDGTDLVFHFFPHSGTYKQLWEVDFAHALDVSAQEYFKAQAPQLAAKFTEELHSWFLRAGGFGLSQDPQELARRYCKYLETQVSGLQLIAPRSS